jgi:hypothetical protein
MKKEIEFDFAKWGQEGISVKSDGLIAVAMHQNNIKGLIYGIDSKGIVFHREAKDFTMFEEVKPREYYMNVYKDGSCGRGWTLKHQATDLQAEDVLETIKVREVLD